MKEGLCLGGNNSGGTCPWTTGGGDRKWLLLDHCGRKRLHLVDLCWLLFLMLILLHHLIFTAILLIIQKKLQSST